MSLKKCLLIAFSIIMLFFLFFTFLITRVDYNDKMPTAKQELKNHSFHIKNHLEGLTADNLINTFPYRVFSDSVDIYNINSIKESILEIDAVSKDNMLSQKIVSIALTDSLFSYSKDKFTMYTPDSLILQLQWVERYKYYADLDKDNETLYQVINDYWMNHISNTLINKYKTNYDIKYDYKFKYIMNQLEQRGYKTGIGFSNFEKGLNNIVENKLSYLLNKTISRTSMLQKICILMLLLLTIFSYLFLLLTIIKKINYAKKS